MFSKSNYSGFLVKNRSQLLAELAQQGIFPSFPRLVAEHITYAYPDSKSAPEISSAVVTGIATGSGVEALVVEINRSAVRPDGKIFHLTFSLGEKNKPFESNALLQKALQEGSVREINPISLETESF